jgi:ABC-type multidrug transport system fused ATPase/permease subunit
MSDRTESGVGRGAWGLGAALWGQWRWWLGIQAGEPAPNAQRPTPDARRRKRKARSPRPDAPGSGPNGHAGDPLPLHDVRRSKRSELHVFFLFLRWMLPVWPKAVLVLVLSLLAATLSVLPPWLNKFLVDEAIPHQNWKVFYLVFFGGVTLDLMNRVNGTVRSIINKYIDIRVNRTIKRRFFEHLQHLSMTFLENRPVGEHMYRASADIDAVMTMITDILPEALDRIYQFVLILIFTTFLSPVVTVIILIYALPYAAMAHWVATRVRRLDRAQRERWQARDAGLQEGLAGVDTVKVYGRRRHEVNRQIALTIEGFRANQRRWWMGHMVQAHIINGILPMVKNNAVRAFFLREVILGRLTYGSVFPIVDYMNRLVNPIQQLISFFQQVRVAMVPAERILETMDVRARVTEQHGARLMPPLQGEIRFENVSFQYENGRGVLSGLNFEVRRGQKIAIVGHSGAGKSTIASLLLRLYDPTEGQVLVDGIDLREVKLRSYQQQVGLVLQDTHCFRGTVRENLLFSNPHATEDEIVRAAKLADIHDLILALPDGYDEPMGENSKLSVGERQRLGIARALLRNPAILLLDEPTSSLDSQTERRVQETMRKAAEGRTTILISHRLNTVLDADEIWVMDRGQIVERGTHEDLLRKRGHYCRMYSLYFGLVDRGTLMEPDEDLVGAV